MTDARHKAVDTLFEIKDRTRVKPELWNPHALAVLDLAEQYDRLREALREMLSVAEVDQLENLSICDIGSERSKMKSRAVASRCGMLLGKLRKIARAALEEGK